MNTHEASSYVGAALAACEFVFMLPDEVNLIWRPPRLTVVKLLYLFSRYFCLIAHPCNIMFARKIASQYPVPMSTCRSGFAYQAIVTFTLMNMVDAILLLRLYAFYNRGRRTGIALCATLITKVVLSVLTAVTGIRRQTFGRRCEVCIGKVVIFGFFVPEMITQCIILSLTFAKQILFIRDVWLRAPVLGVLYRDGLATFAAVVAGLLATFMYGRFACMKDDRHFIFPMLISMLSSVACRMVLNMQRLAVNISSDNQAHTIELTTFVGSIPTQEHGLSDPLAEDN